MAKVIYLDLNNPAVFDFVTKNGGNQVTGMTSFEAADKEIRRLTKATYAETSPAYDGQVRITTYYKGDDCVALLVEEPK